MNTEFLAKLVIPPVIERLLESGAHLVISISGGKDSDCMARLLACLHQTRGYQGQILLIHSDLSKAEHKITPRYIEHFAAQIDVPIAVINGGDLVEVMRARFHQLQSQGKNVPFWPSASARYCTSMLKRDPISKFLRQWVGKQGQVVCAIGLRAEESSTRAKKPVYQLRANVHTQTRTAYDWHPILNFTQADVWQTLGYTLNELAEWREKYQAFTPEEVLAAGFKAHPAYIHNLRLSCALCILGCLGDLQNGARQNPEVYREYVALEVASGFSFQPKRWLGDVAPELLTPELRTGLEMVKQRRASAPPMVSGVPNPPRFQQLTLWE
jgi:3'-phosphoadenosine 5'-phosphosulfate sulfotransferase (PAPS reductase)/FAD synthetase